MNLLLGTFFTIIMTLILNTILVIRHKALKVRDYIKIAKRFSTGLLRYR